MGVDGVTAQVGRRRGRSVGRRTSAAATVAGRRSRGRRRGASQCRNAHSRAAPARHQADRVVALFETLAQCLAQLHRRVRLCVFFFRPFASTSVKRRLKCQLRGGSLALQISFALSRLVTFSSQSRAGMGMAYRNACLLEHPEHICLQYTT